MFKWGDYTVGVVVDPTTYAMVFTTTIYPVSAPAGIASVNLVQVAVYPNPASEWLQVRFEALEHNTEVALYDLSGRQLAIRTLTAGCSEVSLPVSQLADGVYLLRVGEATAKVVVRH